MLNDKHLNAQRLIGNWENGGAGIYISDLTKMEGDLYTNVRHPIYSNVDVSTNHIYQAVLTYSGTSEILYYNGENIGSVNTSGTVKTAEDDTVMAIGANPKGQSAENEFFDGRIYSVAIYDRALTTEEIAHNFKVDQIKYGIEKNEE